jgi:hypothetical protein
MVSGNYKVPSSEQMQKTMDEEQAFLRRHYPKSVRYALELDPVFYRQQMSRERQRAAQH